MQGQVPDDLPVAGLPVQIRQETMAHVVGVEIVRDRAGVLGMILRPLPAERARGGSGRFGVDATTSDFAAFEKMANAKR